MFRLLVDNLVVERIGHRQVRLTVPAITGCSIELVVPLPRHCTGLCVLPDCAQLIDEHLAAEVVRANEAQDGDSAPEAEKSVTSEPKQAAPVVSMADKKAPPPRSR